MENKIKGYLQLQRKKYVGINVTNEVKEVYTGNHKTPRKEIKNIMQKLNVFMSGVKAIKVKGNPSKFQIVVVIEKENNPKSDMGWGSTPTSTLRS